jgi:hypothetical protein
MMALPPVSTSGVNTAILYGTQVTAGAGIVPIISADPGNINPPIIFEPPGALTNCQLEIFIIVTGASPNWGGCQVWVSADDTTFGVIGTIGRGGVQGVLTAPFPAGADPDRANTLSVDLTESAGTLTAATAHDADLGLTLAYVDGELVSYSSANLTSLHHYNLSNYLRRGAYGTSISAHPAGSAFGLALAAFIHEYPANLIGQTLYFKFPSFNSIGAQPQDLASVSSYPYKVTGAGQCPAGGVAANVCPTTVVLAGGAAEIDWGALDSTCIIDCADWGHLGDPLAPFCIDEGHL